MKEMPVSKKLAAHGYGHPDQGDGPAPLPGTNRVLLLIVALGRLVFLRGREAE